MTIKTLILHRSELLAVLDQFALRGDRTDMSRGILQLICREFVLTGRISSFSIERETPPQPRLTLQVSPRRELPLTEDFTLSRVVNCSV